MPQVHRQFIEWVARYTMSDVGAVLKMSLSAPEAFTAAEIGAGVHADRQYPGQAAGQPPENHRVAEGWRPAPCCRYRARSGMLGGGRARDGGCGATANLGGHAARAVRMVDVSENRLSFSDHQKRLRMPCKTGGGEPVCRRAAGRRDGVGQDGSLFRGDRRGIATGQQALILLPEISLSAQFLERFERRFGVLPALWHSEVPTAQRRVTWTGVAEGKTKVVVGARSALFLPFADLGLIVVDMKSMTHRTSKKKACCITARDMAIVRARLGSFPVVLVSATPSLETMVNVQQNKYTYLNLPSRHAGARMPDIHVINLKATPPERQKFIAPPLQKALLEVFAAKEHIAAVPQPPRFMRR